MKINRYTDKPKKTIRYFTDLDAWQEAHRLVLAIYKLTNKFPSEERFGLIDQLRRATLSITANVAEGFSRFHYKERLKFYYNARVVLSARLRVI
jgi:four helix bundle protein